MRRRTRKRAATVGPIGSQVEARTVVRVTATAYTPRAEAVPVTLECDAGEVVGYRLGEFRLDDGSDGPPVTLEYLRAWSRALAHAADLAEADPLFMRALRTRDAALRRAQ